VCVGGVQSLMNYFLHRIDNCRKRRKIEHVPFTIDLGGNEQNLSKVLLFWIPSYIYTKYQVSPNLTERYREAAMRQT
jgi:hypothetical protein